jgi:hypothetical protein
MILSSLLVEDTVLVTMRLLDHEAAGRTPWEWSVEVCTIVSLTTYLQAGQTCSKSAVRVSPSVVIYGD